MPRWLNLTLRLVVPLVVVFLTWNPDGWSYYRWAIDPLVHGERSFDAVKFLVGVLLIAAWAVILQATRRSIGAAGAVLMAAISGGVIWLLISKGVVTARSGRGMANAGLLALAAILAVGMSWSHFSRSLTGQADTDIVD